MKDSKPKVLEEIKDNIMKKVDDDKDISSIKPARIPKKEMPTQSQQGHATEGATPF